MEAHDLIFQLLAILITARILGEISAAFGAPAVIGEIAAGIVIGPSLFGLVMNNDVIIILAEIGVILLLFEVGLSLDLRHVDWGSLFFWIFSLTLAVVAICSKFAGALVIREPFARRFVIGMAMVPRGEVGLIFAGLGSAAGILAGDIYTALIIVIAYTTLLSPFWIKLYYRLFARWLD